METLDVIQSREQFLQTEYLQGRITTDHFLKQINSLIERRRKIKRKTKRKMNNEEKLRKLYNRVTGCDRCELHKERTNVVFGSGNAYADVMFIAEAPGKKEDETGLPFQGKAGVNFDNGLKQAGLLRDDVFVCNLLKCRPSQNRNPKPEEIAECGFYLYKQIDIIKPRIVVTLGSFASKYLLKMNESMKTMQDKFYHIYINDNPIHVLPTYHPASIIYDNTRREQYFENFKFLKTIL